MIVVFIVLYSVTGIIYAASNVILNTVYLPAETGSLQWFCLLHTRARYQDTLLSAVLCLL